MNLYFITENDPEGAELNYHIWMTKQIHLSNKFCWDDENIILDSANDNSIETNVKE